MSRRKGPGMCKDPEAKQQHSPLEELNKASIPGVDRSECLKNFKEESKQEHASIFIE